MALSEYEKSVLEELERTWNETQPKWSRGPLGRVKFVVGLIFIIVGFIALIVGVAISIPLVGVLAFTAALYGTLSLLAGIKQMILSSDRVNPIDLQGTASNAKERFQGKLPNEENRPDTFGF